MVTLIDQDIAHISRVMRPSLYGDSGTPILSTAYWRKRLHQLLDAHHVTKAQLCAIDSLLIELDACERNTPRPTAVVTSICAPRTAAASRPATQQASAASNGTRRTGKKRAAASLRPETRRNAEIMRYVESIQSFQLLRKNYYILHPSNV
jgi:hypothetical protein